MYKRLAEWSAHPVTRGETLTVEQSAGFWFGFTQLRIPPERWTADYYRERMEVLYEVMRGRPVEERITLGAQKLTPKQADAVIRLFAEFLDTDDLRLAVPYGYDHLASGADGEYDWCSTCGRSMEPLDVRSCRRKTCELRLEREAEDRKQAPMPKELDTHFTDWVARLHRL